MYEKVEKYIYKIGENNYRIKIKKKDKKTGAKLDVSQNYKLSLEEVIKIRDKFLEEYEEQITLKSLPKIGKEDSGDEKNNVSSKKTRKKKWKIW